jgi:hypothetical protein
MVSQRIQWAASVWGKRDGVRKVKWIGLDLQDSINFKVQTTLYSINRRCEFTVVYMEGNVNFVWRKYILLISLHFVSNKCYFSSHFVSGIYVGVGLKQLHVGTVA